MKSLLLLTLALSAIAYVAAIDYYFSDSDGNDSSSRCHIDSPCKTIERFNVLKTQTYFLAGDRILFKKGDTFRGQAISLSWWKGNQSKPIIFSSYGTASARPIISGTTLLTSWTKGQNGVIQAKVPSNFTDVQNVFVDGKKMLWGRTPNVDAPAETRYLNITASSNNMLQTNMVKDPSGTWNGATIRIRIYLWSVTTRKVTSHTYNGGVATFQLDQPFENGYVPGVGWKFYLENKLVAVDQPSEWSFDQPSSTLTLMPPSANFDATKHQIEASVHTNAFVFVDTTYVQWIGLTFWGQSLSAIEFQDSGQKSGNIVIDDCEFIDQEQNGVLFHALDTASITNSVFTGMQNSALNIQADNVVISNNTISWIGMVQGHQNKGGGVGIQVTGASPSVTKNTVTNTSYNGIVFSNSGHAQIINNYVNSVTLTMSDGGALYTYGASSIGSVIENNIVMNSRSLEWDGFSPDGSDALSHGIYIDNYCTGMTINGNTVVDVDGSCLFANSGDHKWTNNLLVGAKAEGSIVVEEMPGNTVVNNYYANNIVYVRHPEDVGMLKETSDVRKSTAAMATYSHNTYCNPYGSNFYTFENAGYEGGRGWEAWMAEGRDKGSVECPASLGNFWQDNANVTAAKVLNVNPTFDKDTSGWVCSSCNMAWMSSSPVSSSGGSMKVSVNSPSYTQIQTKNMPCVAGAEYRIRFKAYATKEVVFWTGVMEDVPPYQIVPKQNLVFVMTTRVTQFSQVFTSTKNSDCMVMIGASYGPDTVIYLDDFYLEQVQTTPTAVWDYVAVNPSDATKNIAVPANTTFTDITGQQTYTCSVSVPAYGGVLLIYKGPNDPKKCTSEASSPVKISVV